MSRIYLVLFFLFQAAAFAAFRSVLRWTLKELRRRGYNPWDVYRGNQELKAVVDAIASGVFSPGEPRLFQPVVDSLLNGGDPYLVLADFAAYCACQDEVERAYRDPERWTRMAILNVARAGKFSSDRTIREYAEQIWGVTPVKAGD